MSDISKCPVCCISLTKERLKRKRKYCSRSCYNIDRALNIDRNPNWKDGSGVTNYKCQIKYRQNNRKKRNARERVFYAVKTGKIKKMPCSNCGNDKSEAHHEDYEKALDVVWLCKVCHSKQHYS